jgi:hypothetical protein
LRGHIPGLPDKVDQRDYESIETITDAWKTLGVNGKKKASQLEFLNKLIISFVLEIKHTENVSTPEDELMEFVWQRTHSQQDKNDFAADTSKDVVENYDKLEFFRSNNNISSGYKTIVPIKQVPKTPLSKSTAVSDDYEIVDGGILSNINTNNIVATDDKFPYRTADDSHLGYGIIRKAGGVVLTSDEENDKKDGHRKFNGLDYAVVSKTKRV